MSRSVDVPTTLGKATVIEHHGEDDPTTAHTVTIEATIGGVHGNRITVTADWWDENTPEPTP